MLVISKVPIALLCSLPAKKVIDFYELIVSEAEGWINYYIIEVKSE